MMNRRVFCTRTLAVLAVSSLPIAMGCGKQSITDILKVISVAGPVLATALGSTIGPKIAAAVQAAITLVNGWVPGSPSADVEASLRAVLDMLTLIPIGTSYDGLVMALAGGVQGILALIPTGATAMATWRSGRPIKPIPPKDFKAAYNAQVRLHPELHLKAM